jgi:GNAT superfamily N-acetyltransferase
VPDDIPIVIRDARRGDVGELLALVQGLFGIEADFDFDAVRVLHGLGRMLDGDPDRRVWAAESGGRVVGMCTAQVVVSTAEGGDAAWIEDVVVLPEHRGRRIGSRLLDVVEDWACRRGIRRLQLVADNTNAAALAFYARQGWTPTRLVCLRRTLPATTAADLPRTPADA